MKFARCLVPVVVCLLIATTGWASVAPPSEAAQREQTRKELTSFFTSIGDDAPKALTSIKRSPETMKAIRSRIDSLTDAEVAEFSQLMREVPDWKSMPQTVAKLLPAETLKKIEAEGANFAARVPKAEKMRDDVRTLVATLKVLPDARLQELGLDRQKLDEIDQTLQQLTPLQVAVLERQLSETAKWDVQGANALNAIPPELRSGALALAKHGPITALDLVELEKYRARVTDLLTRVSALPESSRKALNADTLKSHAAHLSSVTPDVLFMLRERVTTEMLDRLEQKLVILEQVAALTPADVQQLDAFRGNLTAAFDEMVTDPDQARAIRQKVSELGPAEIYLLKQSIPDVQQWKVDAAPMVQALTSTGLRARLASLEQAAPDPARVQELETFRAQALQYIEATRPEVDAALAAKARQTIESAGLSKLEMIRTLTAAMPATATAAARLQLVTNVDLDCTINLGSIHIPVIDVDIPLGSIDMNWICTPIENAINTVTNAVDTLVQGIVNTVGSIWNFVQTIPGLAWDAIKAALNAFLDINLGNGITIRGLITEGLATTVPKLQQALNLAGSWWNALGTAELPLIPCPASGVHTPFGTVGDGAAVTNYNRYKFFIDKIVGLLPDTETSLWIKIPAQVLFAGYEYLGVCLEDAANDANDVLLTTRHTEITGGQTLLSQQLATSFAALTGTVNQSTTGLTSLITNKATDLTNLVNSRSDQQRDLDLRMQIELNLQAGEGKALAIFQLPHANGGYLELAIDLVDDAIDAMLAGGQGVGQAQKMFAQAQSDFGIGRFKEAYKSLQRAYIELTK